MLVKVFSKSANQPNHKKALEYFFEGLSNDSSISSELSAETVYSDCDVAIFFGSWKNRRKREHHRIKLDILEKHNKPFIMLETPLLGREITENHSHYRIGVNHFLADEGNFNNNNRSQDRWNILSQRLNLTLEDYKTGGNTILVALQLPGDASLRGIDIVDWARETAKEIRKYTDRQIIFRPHPGHKQRSDLKKLTEIENSKISKNTLRKDLEDALASVTYTSGMAVDSLLAGVPCFAMDSGSFVYDLMGSDLSNIENPPKPDRIQWINNLSYCQWSMEEIQEGLPWNHLKEVVNI